MIRLLADEHVPLRAVRRLREAGFDVLRVPTVLEEGADDESEVLVYANDHDCLVLTNDADFLGLDPNDSPGVLYTVGQSRVKIELEYPSAVRRFTASDIQSPLSDSILPGSAPATEAVGDDLQSNRGDSRRPGRAPGTGNVPDS